MFRLLQVIFRARDMTSRSESGNLPFMSYQHGSGTDEVLRPTLLTISDGRSYRKLTEPVFGPMRKPEGEGGGGRGGASARPVYIEQDERHLDHHFNGMVIFVVEAPSCMVPIICSMA